MSKGPGRKDRGLGVSGFLVRFVGALILVLLTYNPSGQSAYHWISVAIAQSAFGPLHLILVAILLIGWVVYWIASWRALGVLGVVLAAKLAQLGRHGRPVMFPHDLAGSGVEGPIGIGEVLHRALQELLEIVASGPHLLGADGARESDQAQVVARVPPHLVTGELYRGRWVDIGTPERLASV